MIVRNPLDVAILEALGAREPSWERRLVSEEGLADLARGRRELAAVLARLATDPAVDIRVRHVGGDHYWFLERVELDYLPVQTRSRPAAMARVTTSSPSDEDTPLASSPSHGETSPENPMAGVLIPETPSPVVPLTDAVPHVVRAPLAIALAGGTARPITELVRALAQFGITLAETPKPPHLGPSVIRHRVLLGPGVRLETLRKREEDIGRALGQEVAVITLPGEPYVAIDVPRRPRQIVPLLSGIDSLPTPKSKAELLVPFGVTPDGLPVAHDLSTMPHLIVAGATGGGKTLLLRCMLTKLALSHEPGDLELLVIDLKSLDFAAFADLPHLRGGGIVSDPYEAIEALRVLVEDDLPNRTRLLREAECTSFRELAVRAPESDLPAIVVVIDEFADLISVLDRQERDELERSLLRLAQRARAVGIHLVLATQRPSVEFISGSMKANFPCRVSFRLPQRLDSMVVLDRPGAEKLLGAGDMLLLHDGHLHRLQGYHVSVAEEVELLACKYSAVGSRVPGSWEDGDTKLGEP